jgi:hypothetical protein
MLGAARRQLGSGPVSAESSLPRPHPADHFSTFCLGSICDCRADECLGVPLFLRADAGAGAAEAPPGRGGVRGGDEGVLRRGEGGERLTEP